MSELVWTSAAELAAEFGCCVEIIEDLTARGRIPHVRLSPRKVVYPKPEVREWLRDEAHASTILGELEADGADLPGLTSHRRQGAA